MNEKYNIQLASKLSGVGIHTIRAWEKRYNAVSPSRTAKGRREYEESDIQRLKMLSQLCLVGYSISQVATLDSNELQKLLSDLEGKVIGFDSKRVFKESINQDELMIVKATLELAIHAFKLDIINYELTKLKKSLPPKVFALEVVDSLVQLIHKKVSLSELTVAQKQSLYSVLKFHMEHSLHASNSEVLHAKPTFMIMANENMLDEVYTLSAAHLCVHYGLNFISLPDKLAADSIIETCQLISADQLILPCFKSKVVPAKRNLTQTIAKLIECCGDHQKIVIFGNGEFDFERFSGHKKFTYLRDIKALDRYLASAV